MSTKPLQTVSRAVAMLRAFEGGITALTLTELATRLGLEKVNTLRLARTLVHEGLLVHDPRGRRYSISVGCLALCRGILDKNSIAEAARPHLEHARDATGESACLMVREAWNRVVVETAASRQPVRYVLDAGERRPVYIGASGQCLIADLDPTEWSELQRHLNDEKAAGRLKVSEQVILERLQALHDRGFAIGRGEWAADAAGAAAPIYDSKNRIIAAITLAIPLTRASDSHLEMCGRMALAAAQAISGDLQKYGI